MIKVCQVPQEILKNKGDGSGGYRQKLDPSTAHGQGVVRPVEPVPVQY